MKNNPEVSIIILNFNGLDDTRICLKSLAGTRYNNFKAYIVDNGSKVNEVKILAKEFSDLRFKFIRFKINYGFAGGNNRILNSLDSKYVVLLNNDTSVTSGWLNKLVQTAESDKNIAACQPKIKSLINKKFFDYAGGSGGYIDKYGFPFARGRIFFSIEQDEGQYNNVTDIFWASGSASLFRLSALKKVGFLDESFFAYHEETDLCWRLHEENYRIVSVPASVIFHKGLGTSGKNLPYRILLVHRNMLAMSVKHLPLRYFILRPVFDLASLCFYIISGELSFALAVIKAYSEFIGSLDKYLTKRKVVPALYSNRKSTVYQGSIVWDYFILRKKRFSDLFTRSTGKTLVISSAALVNLDRFNNRREFIRNIPLKFSFSKLWSKYSGERTFADVDYLKSAYLQHQKVYIFCTKFVSGKKVLDAGCGSGKGTMLLSEKAKYTLGIDIDDKAIGLAKSSFTSDKLDYKSVKIENFRYPIPFDVAVSLQVIEHVYNQDKYIRLIKNVLSKKAIAVISTPNRLTQGYNENPYHIKELNRDELYSLLKKYFKTVTILGLFGDSKVSDYETRRKKMILKIFSYDLFNFRKLIPRKAKIIVFSFFTYFVRRSKGLDSTRLSLKSYRITKYSPDCIDLIAVCRGSIG